MNSLQFRALLDLFMVSDPWPLTDIQQDYIEELIEYEATQRGFETWVDAYHEFKA
jgi:hypothetical protein